MGRRPPLHGFTLIELLVVITIIVVLLSLLTPALDKAIYMAELTQCAARLDGLTSSVQTYAVGNKRTYPDRDPTDSTEPHLILTPTGFDYRPALLSYASLTAYQCPFLGPLDLEDDTSAWIWSNYDMRAGFTFKGYSGMLRVGDKWAYTDTSTDPTNPRSYRFNIVVADFDTHSDKDQSSGSHPDRGDEVKMYQDDYQDVLYYYSIWRTGKDGVLRGAVDLNWSYQDGSTQTLKAIEPLNDERVARVASWANGQDYQNRHFRQVPKN